MNVIELFCGTCSFSNASRKYGHIVGLTVDNDPQFAPIVCMDVLTIQPPNRDAVEMSTILWASPPCQTFSVASMGHHWGKPYGTPKTEEARIGLALLDKTVEIVSLMKPRYWFIENPRGMMRKVIDKIFKKYHVEPYIRHTVTYCQYGDTRMKPTDIWTNCMSWHPKPMCRNGDKCHERAPRGAKAGTQGIHGARDRAVVPAALCDEILRSIELSNAKSYSLASTANNNNNENNKGGK